MLKILTSPILTLSFSAVLGLTACQQNTPTNSVNTCNVNIYVLGTAQDAGKPQIGHHIDTAWRNSEQIIPASSIAVADNTDNSRYLFDATPDIKAQLYALDQFSGAGGFRLDGIFLTHGHMGHYLGLAQLGREAMGADNMPVFAMPKMASFLENNGPWSQLVALNNISIKPLADQRPVTINPRISVTPFLVPHRGEYTETVGYQITGPGKSAIYLPDIDAWQDWDAMGTKLEDVVAQNDLLFLDATFYNGDELPGRDMSEIPHPTMVETMERLRTLSVADRAKVRFIHLNHSNPTHDKNTKAFTDIEKAGYKIAKTGEQYCLD
ncbi:MAG: pyrroloquinoline quinone biosynthesis protein PqqB [Robiginitomaculum sp.]|nr:MAG: pyrroloquinoline quinone biosynthesis protein PqqB [Robiginitomaculum sp.]